MPIYKGNEFIERVYKGSELLRRVYKGNELTYGLYDITYNDRGNLYEPSNNEIKEYAGGLQRDIAPANGNTDFNDVFEDYRSHWFGGYDDANYSDKRPQVEDQFIVEPDDHKDLDLFAKGKQKKFSYSITYTVSTTSNTNSSGGNGSGGTSAMAQKLADEAMSHIGAGPGELGLSDSWCAKYVRYCLKQIGYPVESGVDLNYANVIYTNIRLGNIPGQTFISQKVCDASDGRFSDMVISEKDLQVGDIINSGTGYWITRNYPAPTDPATGHVVIVVEKNGDTVKVVGGNESNRVVGPRNLEPNYDGSTWQRGYGCVSRIDFGDRTGGSSTVTTQTTSQSETNTLSGDCDDQDNPVLPDAVLDIINADPVITPVEPEPGLRAELPEVGTHGDELPSSGYGENGGWYGDRVYPGECVGGANGRTGQLRNNAAAAAPYSNAYRGWYNANDGIAYGYGDGHGGNGTSTVDGRKVQVGDCILYGSVRTIEADDGSGTIYACAGNHVVVVEEVLGDGSFLVSTGNSGGDHNFHGTYVEDAKPGKRSDYTGVVSGYLINHIDPVVGASGGSTTTTTTVDELDYITSERVYDYNINNGTDGEEVSTSDTDGNYEGGE